MNNLYLSGLMELYQPKWDAPGRYNKTPRKKRFDLNFIELQTYINRC